MMIPSCLPEVSWPLMLRKRTGGTVSTVAEDSLIPVGQLPVTSSEVFEVEVPVSDVKLLTFNCVSFADIPVKIQKSCYKIILSGVKY